MVTIKGGFEDLGAAIKTDHSEKVEITPTSEKKYDLHQKVLKTLEYIEAQTGPLSAIAKGIIKTALGRGFKNPSQFKGAPLDIFPTTKVGDKREITSKQARIAFDAAKTFDSWIDKSPDKVTSEEVAPAAEEKAEEEKPVVIEKPEKVGKAAETENKTGKRWEGGEISKGDFVKITQGFRLVFQRFDQANNKFLFQIGNEERAYSQKELQTLLNQTNDLRERHYETQEDMEKSRDYYKEEAEGAETAVDKDLSLASYQVLNNRLTKWRKSKTAVKEKVKIAKEEKKIPVKKIESTPLFEIEDTFIDRELKRKFRIIERDQKRYLIETDTPRLPPEWRYEDEIENYLSQGQWEKEPINIKKGDQLVDKELGTTFEVMGENPAKNGFFLEKEDGEKQFVDKDVVVGYLNEGVWSKNKIKKTPPEEVILNDAALPPRIQKKGNVYSTTNQPKRKSVINNPAVETPPVPTTPEIKPDDTLETKNEEALIENYLKEFEKKMEGNDLLDLDQFESPEEAAEALLLTLQEMGIPIEKINVVREEKPKTPEPEVRVGPAKAEIQINTDLSGIETITNKTDREEIVRLVQFQIENPGETTTVSVQERLRKYPVFTKYVQSNFERRQKSLNHIDTVREKWGADFYEIDGYRNEIQASTKEKVIELITKQYDKELDKIIGRTIK